MSTNDDYLATLERGIRALADNASGGMLIVAEGRVVHANDRGLTLLRSTAAEILGRKFVDLIASEHQATEIDRLARALREGHTEGRSCTVVRVDGTRARVDSVCCAGLWKAGPAVIVRLTDRGDVPAETPVERHRILVVDDEVVIGNVVRRILRDHDVVHVTNAEQAIDLLARERFDVILCDVMMPGMSGVDLFELVVRDHPRLQTRFVFVTGGAFTKRARDFLATVPNPRIDKPFEAAAIRDAITSLVRH